MCVSKLEISNSFNFIQFLNIKEVSFKFGVSHFSGVFKFNNLIQPSNICDIFSTFSKLNLEISIEDIFEQFLNKFCIYLALVVFSLLNPSIFPNETHDSNIEEKSITFEVLK